MIDQVYQFNKDKFIALPGDVFLPAEWFPDNSILLDATPFNFKYSWINFWQACQSLQQQIKPPQWVFVNATCDSVQLDNERITLQLNRLQDIFPRSKICMLSAKAQHWYDDLPGCLYVPWFLACNYYSLQVQPRQGRIGCLNRKNRSHRIYLMHSLLSQQLIDSARDVFSISFVSIDDDSYQDIDRLLPNLGLNEAQQQWPKQMATHPDDFPSDYSIHHPAWHTGISIITETEPGDQTIITEKIGKGIVSRSCFSIYMADVGYKVLEDLGFQPRFFPDHAENYNIKPILDICKNITTESQALEYRQHHIEQINHNFDWFDYTNSTMSTRPWFAKYKPKLDQCLNSL